MIYNREQLFSYPSSSHSHNSAQTHTHGESVAQWLTQIPPMQEYSGLIPGASRKNGSWPPLPERTDIRIGL